ncbi:hypothetical protein Pmani_030122 [Petrolisthes manimaculis]|uniref:Uncharacterized protein n=1 Tax=Petrolisthes manimaculis TaxID=1843537 RepID=A0AAE1NW66_9EUCA|nr:hypothetical protein Pmani_030122 [Petrolisthes manimaculis]
MPLNPSSPPTPHLSSQNTINSQLPSQSFISSSSSQPTLQLSLQIITNSQLTTNHLFTIPLTLPSTSSPPEPTLAFIITHSKHVVITKASTTTIITTITTCKW